MNSFISYSWDDEAHTNWVRNFANTLIENGISVTLDQYDLQIASDRFQFMERSVRDAECILCICTPNYVRRANERSRGVGVETQLITPKFFEDHKDKQFIPIIRAKSDIESPTPDYLSALIYVDFTDDQQFEHRMEELLRYMHQQPRHVKPELGAIPDFESVSHSSGRTPTHIREYLVTGRTILEQFAELQRLIGSGQTDEAEIVMQSVIENAKNLHDAGVMLRTVTPAIPENKLNVLDKIYETVAKILNEKQGDIFSVASALSEAENLFQIEHQS